jgi:hypothetical protein
MPRQDAAAQPPWMFWGGFAACLAAIAGLWLLTLPDQWAKAERPVDRPRWSTLDQADPAGRLKAQLEAVSTEYTATSTAITNALRVQRVHTFAAALAARLSTLPAEPAPAPEVPAPVSAPSVPTP